MKHTLLVVSCLSLGLGAVGCGSHSHSGGQARAVQSEKDGGVGETHFSYGETSSVQPRLKGAAVGNYNKGYTDGVVAAGFFNKGRPMTDDQVDRLIEIGRRQGDPTGLLALNGYPDGYRAGAKLAHNPYEKQMTPEQVATVRKAQGLPVETAQAKPEVTKKDTAQASAGGAAKKQRKESGKSRKDSAEASARD
jgi:hypothetical protein